MADPEIQLQPGERICYRTHPNRKWYVIAWKVLIGAAGVFFFSILIMGLLAQSVVDLLSRFLPEATSFLITQILCLGLVPLLILAWVVEDIVQTFRGAFVLTDRRIWVRCSPYTWNRSEIPLDDISKIGRAHV